MRRLLSTTAALMFAVGLYAQEPAENAEPALKVGNPAPALDPGRWIKGEPVKGFETGKVYVVEFWATWCGPCRMTIPHLSQMQAKFKDRGVVFIGQNCFEDDAAAVEEFVKGMGAKMEYRVALDHKAKPDDEQGVMAKNWMEASGQQGIPTAFVVDASGKLAWMGHPMDGLEQVLEGILSGHYDPAAVARAQEKRMEKFMALGSAMEEEKWDDALSVIDGIVKEYPDMAAQMGMARFSVLLGKKDITGAQKQAGELADASKDQPELLNELAWTLVTTEEIKTPDLALAERIARMANEAAKGEEPGILDTLARVLFMKGDKEQAIAMQTKAIELTADEDAKAMLKETLESYKAGKLPPAAEASEEGAEEVPAAPVSN